MVTTAEFLADPPRIHSWDGGATWHTGGFGEPELRFIVENLAGPDGGPARVAETGAGCSTLAFIMAGAARLHSVSLEPEVIGRIRSWCRQNNVSDQALEVYVDRTERVLPPLCLDLRARGALLDFALIDGGHGWPTVFVDFCYLHAALRSGGLLMIDDFQLHSVKELVRFLKADGRFRLEATFMKTIVFRKLTDLDFLPDFGAQPYILSRTQRDEAQGTAFALDD